MKKGLILEGGAMRGMFSAGVLDVMMENGLKFDGLIGVSAGAVVGCNYKSNQPGRMLRYNLKYCHDPRYSGVRSLIRTGDIYGEKFCYQEIPLRLDPFDVKTFQASPVEFYAVSTDVMTGKAVYHKCETGDDRDLKWIQGSASMPLVSRIVTAEDRQILDGGISDSIPVRYFEHLGYDRNVVILTQPIDYVKKKNQYMPVIRRAMKDYPEVVKALARRHEMYNETIRYICQREKQGELFVIRPSQRLQVKAVEHNAARLRVAYAMGRAEAKHRMAALKEYLGREL